MSETDETTSEGFNDKWITNPLIEEIVLALNEAWKKDPDDPSLTLPDEEFKEEFRKQLIRVLPDEELKERFRQLEKRFRERLKCRLKLPIQDGDCLTACHLNVLYSIISLMERRSEALAEKISELEEGYKMLEEWKDSQNIRYAGIKPK